MEAANNTHVLRSIPDLDDIMANLNDDGVKQATVIGAGFIGIEMAENLAKLGLAVKIVEKAPHVLPPLDEEMAQHILLELEKNNIKVITNQSVVEFKEQGRTLVLEDGTTLNSDLNILSVGVQPENSLAKEAGIKLGLRGGIVVDDQYRTSVPDIYAVGDAIVVKQQITGQDALISLASPANRQGRQVADIIAGLESSNKGSIGTAIVRVFEMAAASTGLNERTAKLAGLNPSVVHISGKSHASYFPGAEDIHLKFLECLTEQAGDLHAALQNFGQAMSQFVFDQDKYDLYYYRYLHWTDALSRDWHQKKRSYYQSFYAKLNGLDLDLEVLQYVKVVVHGLIERIFRDNLSQEQFLSIYQQQMEWIEKGIKE